MVSLGVLNPPRKITSPTGTTTESNSNYYLGMGNGFVGKVSDKLFIGMAAGGVSGMGVDFPSTTLPQGIAVVSKKGLLKITPTVAYKPIENLTIGVSLHIGQQSLALKNPNFTMPQTEAWGFGGAFGIIYHILPNLQAGLSYISKMDIAEYEFNGTTTMRVDSTGDYGLNEGVYKMDMDSPQQLAFGLAFRPMPKLLIAADVKWNNFSDVMDEIELKTPAGTVMPITFGWDDQMVYALGIEFMPKPDLCIKTGYNYGATPIGEEDVNSNIGAIAVVEHHVSIGISKKWNETCTSTLSYTHGFHNELESSVDPDGPPTPIIIEAEQNIAFLQFSFRL